MNDQQEPLSAPAAFFATLWGKVLAVLAAVTMILGIYIEIIQAWRATNEGIISGQQAKVAPQMQPAAAAATVADAQIKEATAREALRRQKAEADEAVARACNTRMEQLKLNVYSEDVTVGGGIKPGSRTARMLEAYDKDCNRLPNESASATREARDRANMEHAKICDEQFKALLNEMRRNLDANDFDALDKMSDRLDANRSECPMTDAQREEARPLGQAIAAKLEAKTKADREALLVVRAKARAAIGAQDWQEAYELSVLYAKAAEAAERGHPGQLTTEALAIQALGALFTRRFEAARSAAERSHALKPTPVTRLAHANALLLLGRTDEAKSIFRAGTDDESTAEWTRSLSDNLKTLRSLGLPDAVLSEIEKEFVSTEQPATRDSGTRSVSVSSDNLVTGNQVPDPDIEAVHRYKLAADRGDADAQVNLGKMYEAGRGGLSSDSMEAARLYKLSADQGHAGGQLFLGYMYETGTGVMKDLREAARLYRLAADQGNADAQANLADFYERGEAGLRKDACQAIRLRQRAAAQGNTYAQKLLFVAPIQVRSATR